MNVKYKKQNFDENELLQFQQLKFSIYSQPFGERVRNYISIKSRDDGRKN